MPAVVAVVAVVLLAVAAAAVSNTPLAAVVVFAAVALEALLFHFQIPEYSETAKTCCSPVDHEDGSDQTGSCKNHPGHPGNCNMGCCNPLEYEQRECSYCCDTVDN